MGRVEDILTTIARSGFDVLGHFTLPEEAWWDDVYTPMARRLDDLRAKYVGDEEASGVLDQLAEEPALHRQFSDYDAYEFLVARLAD